MNMKYLYLFRLLFLMYLIIGCENQPQYTSQTYEATIFRLKKENDSLKEQLEKCDDWVNFLESKDTLQ